MKNETMDNAKINTVNGVFLGTMDQLNPSTKLKPWEISTLAGPVSVLVPNFELLRSFLSQPLVEQSYQLVEWGGRANDSQHTPVLIQAEAAPINNSLCYLPDEICPVEKVFENALQLIADIKADPLRDMVQQVFENRDILSKFWIMPASGKHHHAYPGGLAKHSIEVAQDMAQHTGLTQVELDLGIAGGLLHDIGKLWSYTSEMYLNEAGKAMGHEMIGLTRMESYLKELESHWPHGAYAMRVMLQGSSRARPDGNMPYALVMRLRACDQRSCERDKANVNHKSRSWMPQPWMPADSWDIHF
jgi:hypothetical protein